MGFFLRSSIPCVWSVMSAFLRSLSRPAERSCSSQVFDMAWWDSFNFTVFGKRISNEGE